MNETKYLVAAVKQAFPVVEEGLMEEAVDDAALTWESCL
ncbi:hypothetical protein PC116_g29552 [Phytophthora cactorum]|nr:hypothetical protein PC116_g29552 [Phytophthora cactorum]